VIAGGLEVRRTLGRESSTQGSQRVVSELLALLTQPR
jgi:hypothetical protein